MTHDTNTPDIFLRKASGLVRAARPIDVFIYNIGLISIGIAFSITQSLGAPHYPGSSLVLAPVLAGALMTTIALGFWSWTVAIPRTGGIYAFLSRSIHPGLAFAISFVDSFTWLFYNSLAAQLISTIGLAPLLFNLSRLTGHAWLASLSTSFSSPLVQFIVGLVAIAVAAVMLLFGTRTFFHIQRLLFVIAIVGTLATVGALMSISRTDFQTSFDAYARAEDLPEYSQLAIDAHPVPFSLAATLGLAMWPFLSFVGSVFSVALGGEVQQVRKSQGIGMFGSIAFATVALAILFHLSTAAFGNTFNTRIWIDEPTATHVPSFYLPVLIGIGSSPWLGLVASLGFLAWAFFWIPATFVYSGRSVLAWSLDRLVPEQLAFVHSRLHTPVNAVLAVAIANVAMLGCYLFTPLFGRLVLVLAAMFAWLPTMAAGALLPWLKPKLFERTDAASLTLGGVPLMTLFCSMSFIATAIVTTLLWNDERAAGHDVMSLSTIAILFVLGLGWYAAIIARRRKQGLNVRSAFDEIPIE